MKMQKCAPDVSNVRSIVDFISQCRGLRFLESGEDEMIICQRVDEKSFTFKASQIEEVLSRTDVKNESFLQINFCDGRKVIFTDNLIGFKPAVQASLDMKRLPKVVTTPDLISFIEVLEDSLHDNDVTLDEIEDVSQYFNSVLLGAEAIGFNLTCERIWMARILNRQIAIGNS